MALSGTSYFANGFNSFHFKEETTRTEGSSRTRKKIVFRNRQYLVYEIIYSPKVPDAWYLDSCPRLPVLEHIRLWSDNLSRF